MLERFFSTTREGFPKPDFGPRLAELRTTYQEIGVQAGHPTKLVYPAGNFDIYPLVMIPSVKEQLTVDKVPFLLTGPVPYNHYSSVVNDILGRHEGSFVDLETLYKSALLTQEAQDELDRYVKKSARDQLDSGFSGSIMRGIKADNFLKILGSLIVNDVDLDTVTVGKFGNDYRMRFTVGEDTKLLTYSNHELNEWHSFKGAAEYNALQNSLPEDTPGTTALIVKADLEHIARLAVPAFDPDVVIGDDSLSFREVLIHYPGYQVEPLSNPSYPNLSWGYTTASRIRIGKKEASLA